MGSRDIVRVVCGSGRNPTLRLCATIFSDEIDMLTSKRRDGLGDRNFLAFLVGDDFAGLHGVPIAARRLMRGAGSGGLRRNDRGFPGERLRVLANPRTKA